MKRVLFWGGVIPAVLRWIVPRWFVESPLLVAARHPWLTLGAVGGALAVGGFAFATSGVMSLKASSGHWAITERLLHFSLRQSVSTHSATITAPELNDRALVLRGAGHYDLGCRPCHGSVGGDRPRVARAMLPPPPELPPRIPTWSAAQLFYIVKHGVKFTGMPAWPTQQRDDEVWAMVAFMQRLPHLDRAGYLALTRGEPETTLELDPSAAPAPDVVRESCARCHGFDGNGRGSGGFPRIGGQREDYMRRALRAYADGRRHSGVMASVVAGLTPELMDAAVRHYASRGTGLGGPSGSIPPAADVKRGHAIATRGIPARDIPACVECHGPTAIARNPAYPILAGQYAEYLVLQLRLLRDGRRGGAEYVDLMHTFVNRLSAEDMRDATAFFATLQAGDTPLR